MIAKLRHWWQETRSSFWFVPAVIVLGAVGLSTGLLGLALGIAFFLTSIFLSMQRPFEMGDLVEISGVTGFVHQLNVRTTILMTLDGNLAQIPYATVYKNNLLNFTTNSNRREDFVVGIGYDDSINEAQEIARQVLVAHPAVLNDPEPLVLAENLGNATVTLRIYFWVNGREHSWLKVRSSLIRLVKRAYQKHGISMPDEAREVVFPQGVPVTMLQGTSGWRQSPRRENQSRPILRTRNWRWCPPKRKPGSPAKPASSKNRVGRHNLCARGKISCRIND